MSDSSTRRDLPPVIVTHSEQSSALARIEAELRCMGLGAQAEWVRACLRFSERHASQEDTVPIGVSPHADSRARART